MSLEPGANFGTFRIVEQVGRGGMATVYKAYQPALARYVAIKVLPPFFAEEPGFRERFQQEAISVAGLRHPNILSVFDSGEEDGMAYLVTEFVDGGTLADQLGSPLPVDYAVRVLGPIASALDYAHARGVLHRDVKPSNVLLARDGNPVLSDFGLAKMMGSLGRLTHSGTTVGTPEYMSPEQCTGADLGPASDHYALAVVAYEMLTGRVPYTADTPLAVLLAHVHNPLPLPREVNPALSPSVETVLLKGLAKEPAARFASASELVAAIADASRQRGSEPAAPAAPAAVADLGAPAASPGLAAGVASAAPDSAAEASPPAAPRAAPRAAGRRARALPLSRGVALAAAAGALLLVGGALAVLWAGGGGPFAPPPEELDFEPLIPECPARVGFGETIYCYLSAPGEIDTYTFIGEASDRIRVRVVERGGDIVPSIEVLQPDRGRVCGPSQAGEIDCDLAAAGPHTILITDATRGRRGDYNLHLQRLSAPLGCQPVSSGAPAQAAVEVSGQVNCFSFATASPDRVRVRVAKTDGEFIPSIEVLRSDGARVCGPGITGELECALDSPGRHTTLVGDGPTPRPRTGRYTLTISSSTGSSLSSGSLPPTDTPASVGPGTIEAPRGFSAVPLRSAPNVGADVVRLLRAGSRVDVLEGTLGDNRRRWLRVRTESGVEGWLLSEAIART